MDFSKAIKYVVIGGLASVVPGVLGGILPFQGTMLGIVLIGLALFTAGKIPAPLPQVLGVAGGGILAGGLFGNLLSGITGTSSPVADGGAW